MPNDTTTPPQAGDTGLLTRALDKHFLACAAAAAAGAGGVLVPAGEAAAEIRYSGVRDIEIDPTNDVGLYIDVDSLITNTSNAGDWDLNLFSRRPTEANPNQGHSAVLNTPDAPDNRPSAPVGVIGAPPGGVGSYAYVSRLGAGVAVNGSSNFVEPPSSTYPYSILAYRTVDGYNGPFAQWNGGVTDGFVGFRFTAEDGEARFGWARLSVADDDAGFTMTLHDFAWEDQPGVGITTGAIPEPAAGLALAVLALGAAGVRPPRKPQT